MASEVTVSNMALVHCGSMVAIASLTEASAEARACNRFWLETAMEMQRETIWNFNTRVMVLSRVIVGGNPDVAYSSRWSFPYRRPAEALRIQAILPPRDSDGTIADTVMAGRIAEIPYEVISDSSGEMILTNQEDAEIRYSHFVDTVDKWPVELRIAMSFRLASYILPAFAGKQNRGELLQRSLQFYALSLTKGREVDAREGVTDDSEDSDMIRSRG